jgi:DHA3 family macrolide efflux protein-like MFS transporter
VWGGFDKKVRTMILGMLGFAIAFLILGLVPANMFWLAVIGGACIGLTVPLIDGPLMAILQSTVNPEMQGRVFTLFGSLVSITSPLGLSVAGPISDRLGLQIWYMVASVLSIAGAVVFGIIPAAKNIEENAIGNDTTSGQLALAEADM